ncbi:MAG: RagB/SusD family nutrient uptake outer membrane protein [Ginsengibacter sp.]
MEIPPPENQLVSENAFADDKTADATMAGLYSIMNAYNYQFGNVLSSFMPAFGSDEFYYAFSNTNFDEFKNDALTPDNSYVNSFWESSYSSIYQANAVMEGIDKSTSLSENTRNQLMGEAKFVRAFCYFYLVNRFGDVPLILNTDYKVNTVMPRTEKSQVWDAIVKDLTDAQGMLSSDYNGTERIRPNKQAATTLLARTYLYLGKWDLAEAEATKVINDPKYKLLDNLNDVFLKNSEEAIWQLQSVNKSTAGVNTWEGFNIVPFSPTGRAYYNLYDVLVNSFEPGDARLANWTKTYVTGGKTYHFPYKYKIRTAAPVQEYTMVIRFAELFLIRAEARAQQGELDDARDDLDKIRERAALEDLPAGLNKDQLLAATAQERRVELFAEWGHRWFDLVRTGKAIEVLKPIKPEIDQHDLIYPIPLSAMRTNPFLVQNPGYN